jgi:Ca2+/Na+ antiporter
MNKHLKILRNAFLGSILLVLVIALMGYVMNKPLDPSRLWLGVILLILGILNGYAETVYKQSRWSYAIGSGIFFLAMILLVTFMWQGEASIYYLLIFFPIYVMLIYFSKKRS